MTGGSSLVTGGSSLVTGGSSLVGRSGMSRSTVEDE